MYLVDSYQSGRISKLHFGKTKSLFRDLMVVFRITGIQATYTRAPQHTQYYRKGLRSTTKCRIVSQY